MTRNKKAAIVLPITVLVGVMAVVGLAQATQIGKVLRPDTNYSNERPAKSLDRDLAAKFSVLRSPTGIDALPEGAIAQLEHGPAAEINGNMAHAVAINVDIADGAAIVIPGDKGVCVAVPDGDGGYGVGCFDKSHALTGRASVTDGDTTVTLVPDGIGKVSARNADGDATTDRVSGNLAVNRVRNPIELSLDGKTFSLTE